MQLSEVKKTVVTALGMIVAAGSFLLPYVTNINPEVANTVGMVVGVATVILNYLAPNETTDPDRVAGRSVRLKGEKPPKHAKPEPEPLPE